MSVELPPMVLSILGAVIAGGLVGFEREFRGRPAGFRTHILVSLASAVLMLAAVNQDVWPFYGLEEGSIVTDPTRMAHGILTGIGFLCAGVIFREGFSIHGLTTAASLWITSALGIVFGVGMWGLAMGATAATLIVLVALRIVDDLVPSTALVDVVIRSRRDEALTVAELSALFEAEGVKATLASTRLLKGGEIVEQVLRLRGRLRARTSTEALARRLGAAPQVREFEISPRDD